ncbi:threonine--tRNA ligase [Cereibacter sphaeroides]|uniref:threonine--tRNA ligase n=1 Tax=Cereibacter sphaeroides TaxID=1063 RepID=UPI001EEEE45E|nr:threonine--tRNA ligase [Cereibacter sphaeroides]MCE6958062.1 threonine--tRNA ligase [Cereibacter sphaeroides]MCE6971345.1 threonine--tRNA ligase [Cereibacter sphaeroides]
MEPNDHRILARRLDLYHMEEDAPGMIYWHGPGWRLYRALEDEIRGHMRRLGYEEVRSPQLLPKSLWEASGHWEKFGANMFAVPAREPGGRDMALKPMSCPCHIQIFNADLKSWRDLPVRYAEFGICHRDEPSGSMHGLMRSRGFEQDDAHVLLAPDQVEGEVLRFVQLLARVYADLGFPDFEVALSLRPALRAGSDADWDRAEEQLLAAARSAGLDPGIQPGEGAFYGPKLEFALKDRQGRSWQCGTIQLDMVLPGRLGASYIDRNGDKAVPVMLHHAVLGSMGRFIGILLEHHEGRLPFRLAPRQVAVLPIAELQRPAAEHFAERLRAAGLRPVLLDGSESLQRRLVSAHELLIPVHAVIGRREAEAGQVMLQEADGRELADIPTAVARLLAR